MYVFTVKNRIDKDCTTGAFTVTDIDVYLQASECILYFADKFIYYSHIVQIVNLTEQMCFSLTVFNWNLSFAMRRFEAISYAYW